MKIITSLFVGAAVSIVAAAVEIPDFNTWKIVKIDQRVGEGRSEAPSEDFPQGRIIFTGLPGNYAIWASTDVEAAPGQEYHLEVELRSDGVNPDAVAAFRATSTDASGKTVIVTDGGLPKAAAGMTGKRVFVLPGDKIFAGSPLVLSFYAMKLQQGSFTLTAVRLVPVKHETGHTPAEIPEGRGGIIFNEDCTEFFATRPDDEMTVEGAKAYIDRYLPNRHQIRLMMLNPAAYDNNFGGKSCPVMWEGVTFNADGSATDRFGRKIDPYRARMLARMKSMADRGINIYHLWIDHLRERGVSPWISLRMNDAHDALTPDAERIGLKRDPGNRIAPYNPDDWHDQALDYEKPEVRDFYRGIMFELMDTFDADGYELDWMRFGRNFKHGRETIGAPLLTGMMREFRARADKLEKVRGHKIRFAARVPSRPDIARRLGYDVESWAREGLIDILIPTAFLWVTDGDTPIAEWRRITGDRVLIAPAIERALNPYVVTGYQGDAAARRGFASGWFERGADMIYLFNHMSLPELFNDEVMRTAGTPATANAGSRRHPLTFADFPAIGISRRSELPAEIPNRNSRAFRIPSGPAPEAGRRAWVIAGAATAESIAAVVRLNSRELEPAELPALEFGEFIKRAAAWKIPDGVLLDDENVIEITRSSDVPLTVNWLEIYIEPARTGGEE